MAKAEALHYLEDHFEDFVQALIDLARIPSVSFPGYDPEPLDHSADQLFDSLSKLGAETKKLRCKNSPPYILAEWITHPSLPTVLLYAHHDVQPPMREEVWISPPFDPTRRDGRLYGRGVADDKAGVFVHIGSISSILQSDGKLPVNVKVLIEGEEEIGSPHLESFLREHLKSLSCDVMILTDLMNYDTGVPSLTTSLRGMVVKQVEIKIGRNPLHSGLWGGPIYDPISALAKIIAGLTDEQGDLDLPEWKEKIPESIDEEKRSFSKLRMEESVFKKQAGLLETVSLRANKEGILKKLWREPNLVANAIQSGEKGKAGNVIMESAWCRLGVRIAPGLRASEISRSLNKKIRALNKWKLPLHIEEEAIVEAWRTPSDHPIFVLAMESLKFGYRREPVLIGCGATIPFAGILGKAMEQVPALLVGIEDPYTNAHAENESLHLGDFKKAIRSQIDFFYRLAEKKDIFNVR